MENLIISIDGPAGAGKSTIAKIIATKLKINYIDTGAMYRAMTYKVLENNIDVKSEEEIIDLANNTIIDFKDNNIYLDDICINEEIRTPLVSKNVSSVAQIVKVREIMVEIQRKMGQKYPVIMDGRDIGSYVFPKATYKFYLTAKVIERAKRRYDEMIQTGYKVNIEDIIEDIKSRDEMDSKRKFAPLVKPENAIEIDTSDKNIDEVVNIIMEYVVAK